MRSSASAAPLLGARTGPPSFASPGRRGQIWTTTDGGSTWQPEPTPAAGIEAIACPTLTTCYAVDFNGGIIVSSDGGLTWSSQVTPPGTPDTLLVISCPAPSTCFVVGNGNGENRVLETTDGGQTWTFQSVPSLTYSLTDISCPSTETCYASGENTSGGGLVLALNAPATPRSS